MTVIPFTKAHAAENDFVLTWGASIEAPDLPQIARRICSRSTGVGADGWMLVSNEEQELRTRLFNSDGSEPELSGNGIRCAAAFALHAGVLDGPKIPVTTGVGNRTARLISRDGNSFRFEVDMGLPKTEEIRRTMKLAGSDFDATILNVGNPQCVIFVNEFPENWRVIAAEAERHDLFPARTNVAFVRTNNPHAIDALFFERGAGATKSSGTGSTGAATAAILRGVAESPVEISTPGGKLFLRWDESVFLTGPAEIVAEGKFFL